jgi:hypothetical protein
MPATLAARAPLACAGALLKSGNTSANTASPVKAPYLKYMTRLKGS